MDVDVDTGVGSEKQLSRKMEQQHSVVVVQEKQPCGGS